MQNTLRYCVCENFLLILHPEKPKSNKGRLKRHRECLEPDPQCDGKYSNIFSNTLKK